MERPAPTKPEYDVVKDAQGTVEDYVYKILETRKEEIEEATCQSDYHKAMELCLEFNTWLDWFTDVDGREALYDRYRYHLEVAEDGMFKVWQVYNTPEITEVDLDIRRCRRGEA